MAYNASFATLDAFPVTPSDSARISAFGFSVGGTGDVTVMPSAQERLATPVAVTFKACPVGFLVRNMAISRFMATGTTATLLVAFGPT